MVSDWHAYTKPPGGHRLLVRLLESKPVSQLVKLPEDDCYTF